MLSIYVLLDSFVIPHRYASAGEIESSSTENTEPSSTPEGSIINGKENRRKTEGAREKSGKGRSGQKTDEDTDAENTDTKNRNTDSMNAKSTDAENTDTEDTGITDVYHADGVEISLQNYRIDGTDVYVADVKLASADHLKTAFAEDTYGRNITESTSVIADEHNSVLAVNGDFYGSRQSGYVIRNGVLYRDRKGNGNEDLVILKNGEFLIINENDISAQELLDMGAWQVFSFGPALVTDGEIAVDANEEVGKAMQSNPRTAIGIIDDLHYIFAVADGRTSDNAGLSLRELAELMRDLSAKTAYNLDGGGSSTMVFQGEVINNPTTGGRKTGERSVSDIVYIR